MEPRTLAGSSSKATAPPAHCGSCMRMDVSMGRPSYRQLARGLGVCGSRTAQWRRRRTRCADWGFARLRSDARFESFRHRSRTPTWVMAPEAAWRASFAEPSPCSQPEHAWRSWRPMGLACRAGLYPPSILPTPARITSAMICSLPTVMSKSFNESGVSVSALSKNTLALDKSVPTMRPCTGTIRCPLA